MDLPPQYTDSKQEAPATKSRQYWLFGLVFYAGAITAGLVVVSVMGALYLQHMKATCAEAPPVSDEILSSPGKIYTKRQRDNTIAEKSLDVVTNKEIVWVRGEGDNKTLFVFDFEKSIVGIWNSERDECYLIGGIDEQIPDARRTESILEDLDQNEEQDTRDDETVLGYVVARDYPVKSLKLLPAELHERCWGKNVFWLEKENTENNGHIQKRAAPKISIKVCVGVWILRVCVSIEVE